MLCFDEIFYEIATKIDRSVLYLWFHAKTVNMNSYEKSLQKVRFGHFTSFVKSGTEFDLSDPSISDDFTSFIDLHLIFLDQFPLLFRNHE